MRATLRLSIAPVANTVRGDDETVPSRCVIPKRSDKRLAIASPVSINVKGEEA